MYVCPKTGEPYEPSETQPGDGDPTLIWSRCTKCTARGETYKDLGVDRITTGGQWHGEKRYSLLALMDIGGQVAAFRHRLAPRRKQAA